MMCVFLGCNRGWERLVGCCIGDVKNMITKKCTRNISMNTIKI